MFILAYCQRANVESAQTTGQLHSTDQIHWFTVFREPDPAREERPPVRIDVAELEDSRVLQEEVALLGEEQ